MGSYVLFYDNNNTINFILLHYEKIIIKINVPYAIDYTIYKFRNYGGQFIAGLYVEIWWNVFVRRTSSGLTEGVND